MRGTLRNGSDAPTPENIFLTSFAYAADHPPRNIAARSMSTPSLMSDLENAVASHSAERRNDSLRKVTDLFAGGAAQFSEEQVALFDGVIGRLAQDADVTARTELSVRLAAIDNAPVATIERLANDEAIAIAGPILKG